MSSDRDPTDPPADPPADLPAAGPAGPAGPAGTHDEAGLDLARSIARGMAGSRRTPRRRSGASRPGSRPRRTDPQASGAHPDDRDPQTLDDTIGRLISDQGWSTDVRVHGVFTRWEHLVGHDVAAHCTPESYQDGKLVVRTDSTAWRTQVKLLTPTVLRRLNAELGEGTVRLIDVLGPHLPSWKKGRLSSRDGRGPRDTYG